jgi:hypothetical protein
MATIETARTLGSQLASERMDAAIEDAIAGRRPRYPADAVFIGADLPTLGDLLAGYAREQRPVVLVYPDGAERVINPREPDAATLAGIIGQLVVLIRDLIRGRPRIPA